MTRILTREDLRAALTIADCIEALDQAMRELSAGQAVMPPRLSTSIPERGNQLVMPAALPSLGVLGAKCITVFPDNPSRGAPALLGLMILCDLDSGRPLAVMDASYLTEIRTAAASAVATRALARPDASTLALIGAGTQARSHLAAMTEIRPIRRVSVIARSPASAERFIATQAAHHPALDLRVADSYQDASAHADIICSVSSATEPVTRLEWIPPGCHLNGVGAHTPHTREIDSETMTAARVVVDCRTAALTECGDCLIPIAEGRFEPEHVSDEIGQLLAEHDPGAHTTTRSPSTSPAASPSKTSPRPSSPSRPP